MGDSTMNRQPSHRPAAAIRPGPANGDEREGPAAPSPAAAPPAVEHTPLIDIHEGPDGLVLEADLPGVSGPDSGDPGRGQRPEPPGPGRVARPRRGPGPPRGVPAGRLLPLVHPQRRGRPRADLAPSSRTASSASRLPKAERAKTRRIEIKTS